MSHKLDSCIDQHEGVTKLVRGLSNGNNPIGAIFDRYQIELSAAYGGQSDDNPFGYRFGPHISMAENRIDLSSGDNR